MQIYIINPDTNKPVSIDDWRKEDDPTRAQLLAIEVEDGNLLIMSKSYLPGEYTFEEAQKACAAFKPIEGITFRSPSRKECLDIYDARFQGLDEAIKLTRGDYAKRGRSNWTGDRDTDPNYAGVAWYSFGGIGYLGNISMPSSCLALPVAAIAGAEWMAGIKKAEQPEVNFEKEEFVGVAESPLKTFPRVNDFECGSSYRH